MEMTSMKAAWMATKHHLLDKDAVLKMPEVTIRELADPQIAIAPRRCPMTHGVDGRRVQQGPSPMSRRRTRGGRLSGPGLRTLAGSSSVATGKGRAMCPLLKMPLAASMADGPRMEATVVRLRRLGTLRDLDLESRPRRCRSRRSQGTARRPSWECLLDLTCVRSGRGRSAQRCRWPRGPWPFTPT